MKTTTSIIVTSGCLIARAHAEVDSFHTLDRSEANLIVSTGRARFATEDEIGARAEEAPAAATPAPVVETAEAAPAPETAAATPISAPKKRRA